LAGIVGLIGTLITGPRLGVFEGKKNIDQMGGLYKQIGEK